MANHSLLLLLLCTLILWPLQTQNTQITFLDVGQGDGIFLASEGEHILIDCGSSSDRRVGENVLESFLKSQAVRHLDKVFITHADGDHNSGILDILERDSGITVEKLYLPSCAEGDAAYDEIREAFAGSKGSQQGNADIPGSASGCRTENESGDSAGRESEKQDRNESPADSIVYLSAGIEIPAGAGTFYCLSPEAGDRPDDMNDQSLVLLYEERIPDHRHKNSENKAEKDTVQGAEEGNPEGACFRVLLMGDAGKAVENRLIANAESAERAQTDDFRIARETVQTIRNIHILKVGHHGSKSATSEAFLQLTDPDYAVLSYGENNRYGHPAMVTTELLERQGTRRLDTAVSGALTFTLRGNMVYLSRMCE